MVCQESERDVSFDLISTDSRLPCKEHTCQQEHTAVGSVYTKSHAEMLRWMLQWITSVRGRRSNMPVAWCTRLFATSTLSHFTPTGQPYLRLSMLSQTHEYRIWQQCHGNSTLPSLDFQSVNASSANTAS